MSDICELCTRPTRNAAYACDDCGDTFANDLKALVDWLDDDLETALAGTKGAKGPELRGGKATSTDFGLHVNWRAAEISRKLHRALSEAVDHCTAANVRHQSTGNAEPARTVPAMALWLTWRADGLCLDPAAPRYIGAVCRYVEQAKTLVEWEPPERRFLGSCELCGEGHVYAEGDDLEAVCNRCEGAFPAEARRIKLLSELDDRLLTAIEIARTTTHLGLRDDRDRVQNRISQWNSRKRITSHGVDEKGHPRFRFGDIYPMLLERDRRSG